MARSRTIHSMVYNAMKMFMEINPQLFDECSHEYNERMNTAEERVIARQDRWTKVAEQAKERKNGVAPPLPPSTGEIPVQIDEVDEMTEDSQKRLNDMKLQDESGSPKERKAPTSVSPTQ